MKNCKSSWPNDANIMLICYVVGKQPNLLWPDCVTTGSYLHEYIASCRIIILYLSIVI